MNNLSEFKADTEVHERITRYLGAFSGNVIVGYDDVEGYDPRHRDGRKIRTLNVSQLTTSDSRLISVRCVSPRRIGELPTRLFLCQEK